MNENRPLANRLALAACLALTACFCKAADPPQPVELHINHDGEYVLAHRRISHADLEPELRRLANAEPKAPLTVLADHQTPYVYIATVMVAARDAGLRVSFAEEPPADDEAKHASSP